MGLFDSWGDFFSGLKGMASDEANARIHRQYGGDHIYAQEQAGLEMGRILQRFHSQPYQSAANIQEASAAIMNVANKFAAYAATFNTARAQRGAAELNSLAKKITADMGSAGAGGGYEGVAASIPTWAWGVGAVAVVALLAGRWAR